VPCWQAVWGVTFKICVIFRCPVWKIESWQKQTYTKTEACKLYSRVFWIFLPNVIKIDPYNCELYRFKLDAFFLRHSVHARLFQYLSLVIFVYLMLNNQHIPRFLQLCNSFCVFWLKLLSNFLKIYNAHTIVTNNNSTLLILLCVCMF